MFAKKFTLVISFITIFAIMMCSAETFMLKNGNRITGTIISHENGQYEVSADFGIIDLLDTDILRVLSDEEPVKEEVQEIEIKTNAKVREFVPSYEDEKFHDPLYIAYSQSKTAAVALTAAGSVFMSFGVISLVAGLIVYFNYPRMVDFFSGSSSGGSSNPLSGLFGGLGGLSSSQMSGRGNLLGGVIGFLGGDDGTGSGSGSSSGPVAPSSARLLNLLLPLMLTPSIMGFAMLMACIGPWIYSGILLKKWQSKYHVDMSYSCDDKLNVAFAIKL